MSEIKVVSFDLGLKLIQIQKDLDYWIQSYIHVVTEADKMKSIHDALTRQNKVLRSALLNAVETMNAVILDVQSPNLEAERLGNKAICGTALRVADEALKSCDGGDK